MARANVSLLPWQTVYSRTNSSRSPASFSPHFLLHFRSECDPYHCRFWVTFELLLCHFWITLEHKVTASRSWALGARCEDCPSCRAHFARRAGTTRRMGHAHFARWAGTTCRIWHADFVRRAGTTRRIGHALFLPSGDYRTTAMHNFSNRSPPPPGSID